MAIIDGPSATSIAPAHETLISRLSYTALDKIPAELAGASENTIMLAAAELKGRVRACEINVEKHISYLDEACCRLDHMRRVREIVVAKAIEVLGQPDPTPKSIETPLPTTARLRAMNLKG